MGAGKSHVLRFLSENGYLPLEHVVEIDADYFKYLMPEVSDLNKNKPWKKIKELNFFTQPPILLSWAKTHRLPPCVFVRLFSTAVGWVHSKFIQRRFS
jgi:hypothetical protein